MEDGTEAAKCLQHIEIVHVQQCALKAIVPFIRYAKKLTKIAIKCVLRDSDVCNVDIDVLDQERKRLVGARPLMMFLQKWAYLILKYSTRSSQMIKVQRFESFMPIE